jgi:hypothetical protein
MPKKLVSFSQARGSALLRRRNLEIELPEWLVQVLHYRVREANDGATPEETVELNDVIEWYLVSPITIRDVPLIEQDVPGVAAALSRWLQESTYEPPG